MFKKRKLFLGLASVATFLFILMIALTVLAEAHYMLINDVLDLNAQTSYAFVGSSYADENGNLSDEGYWEMIDDSMAYCTQQEEEGSVLLYNNGALPLASDERAVSLFGKNGTDIIYRSGAGGPIANLEYQVDLHKAFADAGFSINETLYNGYLEYDRYQSGTGNRQGQVITRSAKEIGEADKAFYTDDIVSSFTSYNDAAIVTLSRYGSEGADLSTSETYSGQPLLALDPNEADMLRAIEDSGSFDKTIVLLNGSFPIELDWLTDPQYGVDACLWIGNPGYYGLPGVVNVLTGAANPSGHTMEIYASDSMSSPAMMNFGDINYDISIDPAECEAVGGTKYVTYKEGIYVGYKYYETRYEDCILGQGGASSGVGTYASDGAWNYADEVCYPFGFGLSYTTFTYKLNSVTYNPDDDTFTASVTVKNTGNVDGKASVQVYAQSPYTEYDKQNLVEKSAIQLMNYEKVDLAGGEEKTVEVELERYFLASYDANKEKGYIFEPGDYYFAVGNGSHEAMNAILALKGATGLTDHNGDAVDVDTAKTCAVKWTPSITEIDTRSYNMSRYNDDVEVTNIFDDCDVNYWCDDDDKVTYLTRQDWDGTYPTKQEGLKVNERMLEGLDMSKYSKERMAEEYEQYGLKDQPTVADVPHDVDLDEPINFIDMKGVPLDDPKWDTFISQLSLDELAVSVSDYRGIQAVPSIAKPANTVAEGPEGMLATFNFGDKRHTTGFATLPLVAASWDHDLQIKHGTQYGEEALFAGVAMVNGPGTNLVRTPYLGRTSEYFSEDGVLNYYCAGHVVGGMMSRGLIGNIKHCFMNNQETNRQRVSVFSLEQPMRELYARGWEGAFTLGGGMGVMTAYNRIGLTYTASSVALNDTLFRKEWNFQGSIIDDAMSQSRYSNAGDMLLAGTNLFCLDGARGQVIVDQINSTDDGFLLQLLQRANKRLMFALLHSSMGGMDEDAVVEVNMMWWEVMIMWIDIVVGVIAVALIVFYVISAYVKKNDDKPKEGATA